jgi:hypothetical protein
MYLTPDVRAMGRKEEPCVDGRVFRSVANSDDGDVDGETYFWFDQSADLVHAPDAGGTVREGHLVGRHRGDRLEFRYTHLTVDGATATGRSTDRIETLADGRVRLHEEWEWDSKPGSGTSVLEELTTAERRRLAEE